jgi:hypothetical protein
MVTDTVAVTVTVTDTDTVVGSVLNDDYLERSLLVT